MVVYLMCRQIHILFPLELLQNSFVKMENLFLLLFHEQLLHDEYPNLQKYLFQVVFLQLLLFSLVLLVFLGMFEGYSQFLLLKLV